MRRHVHAEKNNLDWTVRRLWLPEALRPIGPRQVYAGAVGWGGRVDQNSALFGMILSPVIALVIGLPAMLLVLPLRYFGILAWEIEAIAWPWGRRGGPPEVMLWRVKGNEDSRRAFDEIAASLEAGNTRPAIVGAERERQRR